MSAEYFYKMKVIIHPQNDINMKNEKEQERTLKTSSGIPYNHNEDTMTAGSRGPALLQDYILHEKMAHFNRERIPERVVHAKGTGAFGTFTVTHDITKYTKAKLFSQVGNQCKMLARFSTVGGEKGSADTERDPRGFALKFYTEDGNWDLVGNNTPVFFIKDAKKFGDFIHTQKRDPHTNLKSPTMMWDFFSLNPESLHQVFILFSDRGTPHGYRHMHGFSSHTFSMINADNQRVWVKFHFKTQQGIQNFTAEEANEMRGKDPDFAQRDLVEAIDKGEFPKWKMYIQVMTEQQAKDSPFNPFDLTKTWSQKIYPLIEVGEMELNQIPDNYFAQVEQAAFAPAHVVPGIGYSPDKMLQGRILSYPDAQRYRIGANYEQLPVNRCPYFSGQDNYHRDGHMALDGNGGGAPNYFPNSFDNIYEAEITEPALSIDGDANWYDRNAEGENDHYSQPGILYAQVMDEEAKAHLIHNLALSLKDVSGPKKDLILNRQLCHFFRANIDLGIKLAQELGINIDQSMMQH